VYSLVLTDEVIQQVDRAAYAMNTSRSNMINQILAEYVSYVTPEKRSREVFDRLESVLTALDHFQIMLQPSDSMISLRSALCYKYNPTIRYSVELYRTQGPDLGELRVSLRSQNSALILYVSQFFTLWDRIESAYIGERETVLDAGRYSRRLEWPKESANSNEELGDCIAAYIRVLDDSMKLFFRHLENPQEAARQVEQTYAEYLQSGGAVL
jgi:hypothetical protein